MDDLESLCHVAVQEPSAGRGHRRIRRVTHEVVGEVVADCRLAQDPKAPELVNRLHEGVARRFVPPRSAGRD